MYAVNRNIFHYRPIPSTSLRVPCRVIPRSACANSRRQLHNSISPSPAAATRHRTPYARKTSIDTTTFLVAAALSFGVAYFGVRYSQTSQSTDIQVEDSESLSTVALSAQKYNLVMASQMPPGRPGNLTAEQEEKLKEMWAATLDVFGVAHEHASTSSTSTAPAETPDKKKKKSRLGLFGKKGKEDDQTDAAGGVNNDKHGQTKEFEQALASQSPESLREAFWSMSKHDHPDALLLRFLRARKWDVQAALVMLVSTMHWRSEEMHVDDDIMIHGEGHAIRETRSENAAEKKEGEDFMAQLRMGKSFMHGTDKDGRPCCYVRVRLHRQGEQSEKSLERFTVFTIETARMMLRPPVDTATVVFDMTDFSMANMDYTPVKFMIKCFEANYPESLGSVLVYKSPWLFQGIWKIIKGWLDPVVASKVHFVSNVDDLQQFIPRDRIMKELGGDEDFVYTYQEPADGSNEDADHAKTTERDSILAERTELVKSYESETVKWMQGEDQGEGRMRLAQRLAENYWKLDPYIRAKSLYDRSGVLGRNGALDFYPADKTKAVGGGDAAQDELD